MTRNFKGKGCEILKKLLWNFKENDWNFKENGCGILKEIVVEF
jgi:hypothetical protein